MVSISLRHDMTYTMIVSTGLLPGLYEFPTYANVSKDTSHNTRDKVTTAIMAQLQKDRSPLVISAFKSVGDVLHLFSHIKKTYRVNWIVLEDDGKHPPSFYFSSLEDYSQRRADVKKDPVKIKGAILTDEAENGKWVPLKEVDEMKLAIFSLLLDFG